MTDILLVAVNARYTHTNLAVRSLLHYTEAHWSDGNSVSDGYLLPKISTGEWTINQKLQDIICGIYERHASVVLFSAYIWNIEIILKVVRELRKILPDAVIGAGGPEAGFRAEPLFDAYPEFDVIFKGEGERTLLAFTRLYARWGKYGRAVFLEKLNDVRGLFVKQPDGKGIVFAGDQPLITDLREVPFPYPAITDPDNRIYYYESSRGCPFDCIYCLSSLDKSVRFMPLERVLRDLQFFLDARVKLVKFVDRTFNLQPARYLAIWRYICDHHNGRTMFHFEIAAEQFTDEVLDFLQSVRPGIMQFEIGIQSTNPETLRAVHRSADMDRISSILKRIPRTIHTHLDLIAGLPYENLTSFGRSFDYTIGFLPDMLQLGFLKVLYGTAMELYGRKNGWNWMSSPPYEVLSTPYLSYKDILFLKDMEQLLDIFYNSGKFSTVSTYFIRREAPFAFFSSLVKSCRESGMLSVPKNTDSWFAWFYTYVEQDADAPVLLELLRFDYLRLGKRSSFPAWCRRRYDKNRHQEALEKYTVVKSTRLSYAHSDYDMFTVNPLTVIPGHASQPCHILFLYGVRGGTAEQTIIF
jgi:radical SAM superfamily enzyme YgiQ (UPF0313 family)